MHTDDDIQANVIVQNDTVTDGASDSHDEVNASSSSCGTSTTQGGQKRRIWAGRSGRSER